MENYKEDIRNTRLGSLGGSDGNLLAQVANIGYVPNSAKKTLGCDERAYRERRHHNPCNALR